VIIKKDKKKRFSSTYAVNNEESFQTSKDFFL
jgi:hypothetical protein